MTLALTILAAWLYLAGIYVADAAIEQTCVVLDKDSGERWRMPKRRLFITLALWPIAPIFLALRCWSRKENA
jgi:hypothetical protein